MADKFNYVYSDPTSFTEGTTPYGTYDSDAAFSADIITATQWIAKRLGHPVMQLEFNSGSIYATFEEAVSEYSLHINNYNMKNWLWDQYGSESKLSGSQYQNSGSNVSMGTGSFQPIHPHMGSSVMLSEQYGTAAGVGGNVTLKSGSITLTNNKQT